MHACYSYMWFDIVSFELTVSEYKNVGCLEGGGPLPMKTVEHYSAIQWDVLILVTSRFVHRCVFLTTCMLRDMLNRRSLGRTSVEPEEQTAPLLPHCFSQYVISQCVCVCFFCLLNYYVLFHLLF